MGKSGEMLRLKKQSSVRYTFTREQLEQHDAQVIREAIKIREKNMQADCHRYVKESLEEFNTGDADTDMSAIIQYMLATCICVLVERFGWKPVKSNKKDGEDKRYRVVRFALAVVGELEKVAKYDDIRDYSRRIAERYGVSFVAE